MVCWPPTNNTFFTGLGSEYVSPAGWWVGKVKIAILYVSVYCTILIVLIKSGQYYKSHSNAAFIMKSTHKLLKFNCTQPLIIIIIAHSVYDSEQKMHLYSFSS